MGHWPHVAPGQRMRIPASLQNRLIELASRADEGGAGQASPWISVPYHHDVLGYNTSETECPVFGFARAVGSRIDPREALGSFLGLPMLLLEPEAADNADQIGVIALDKIPPGKVGRIAVVGLTQARVFVFDPGHRHVAPSIDAPWALQSRAHGHEAIRTLHLDAEPGWGWALVQVGAASIPTQITAVLTSAEPVGTNRWRYAWEQRVPGPNGIWREPDNPMNSLDDGWAYNGFEVGTGSVFLGSGIDVTDLPGTFAPVPLRTAVVDLVLRSGGINDDGSPAEPWWSFAAPTTVDGACE